MHDKTQNVLISQRFSLSYITRPPHDKTHKLQTRWDLVHKPGDWGGIRTPQTQSHSTRGAASPPRLICRKCRKENIKKEGYARWLWTPLIPALRNRDRQISERQMKTPMTNTLIPGREATRLPVITPVIPSSFLKSHLTRVSPAKVSQWSKASLQSQTADKRPLKNTSLGTASVSPSRQPEFYTEPTKNSTVNARDLTNAHCVNNLKTPNRMRNLRGLSCLGWWR